MGHIKFAGRRIMVPRHPVLRATLGVALIIGGLFGFLPILGYWMIPLGLAVLATDYHPARKLYRKLTVKLGNFLHRRWPQAAAKVGYGYPRAHRRRAPSARSLDP